MLDHSFEVINHAYQNALRVIVARDKEIEQLKAKVQELENELESNALYYGEKGY